MQNRTQIIQNLSVSALLVLMLSACGGSTSQGGGETSGTNLQTDGTSLAQNSTADQLGKNDEKKGSEMGTFQTRAPAEDVTASDSALFIAEGDKGVEVIRIGYNDRIDHELVATITGINASKVSLSEDQTELYVQNREGFINVFDIRDIHAPRKTKILTKDALQTNPVSKNGIYAYIPKEEQGLTVYDISNPSHQTLVSKFQQVPVYSLVLVDQGTKALAAAGEEGIALLDLSDNKAIRKTADFTLPGKTLGVSVNTKSGLLFVANGDSGIKVFNLNIFLDQLR